MTLLAFALSACGGGGGSTKVGNPGGPRPEVVDPIVITPTPPMNKPPMFYGYFGVGGNQVAETTNHTSVLMEMWFEGLDAGIAHMIAANDKKLIVGLQWWVYDYQTRAIRPDAAALVRGILNDIRTAGVLDRVMALYPVDEPDVNGLDDATIIAGSAIVRAVAAEYPELAGVKLLVFYGPSSTTGMTLPGLESYDWIGRTEYGEAVTGPIEELRPLLDEEQWIVLIPQGSDPFHNAPEPTIAAAIADPKVLGVIAFLWMDDADPSLRVVRGIRSDGLGPRYCAAALLILTHAGPC